MSYREVYMPNCRWIPFICLALAAVLSTSCASRPTEADGPSVASEAVRTQLSKLSSRKPETRVEAIQALCELREEAAPAIPHLIRALRDERSYPHGSDWNGHVLFTSPAYEVEACIANIGPAATLPLIERLKRGNENERKHALEALGKLKDPRRVPALINAMLHDRSGYIRYRASWVLPEFEGDVAAVTAALVQALKDPRTGPQAAGSLCLIADPSTLGVLIDTLANSGDVDTRVHVAMSLDRFGDPRVVPALLRAMDDPHDSVRAHATLTLGKLQDPAAFDALVKALKSQNGQTQVAAARALGERGDVQAVEPLIEALRTGQSQHQAFRWVVAEALGRLKDSRAAQPLIDSLERDPDPNMRGQAALALGVLGDPRAIEPLLAAFKVNESLAAMRIAEALGNLNDTRAVEPLILALEDRDDGVRICATDALGKLKDARAVEPLLRALKTSQGYTAVRVAQALQALTGKDYTDQLPRSARPSE
jgi:HEAT repeat protein